MEKEHDTSQQHDTPSDKVESSKQSTTTTTANSTVPLPADDPDTLLTVGAFPTRPSDIVSWLDPTLSSLSSALSGHDEKNNISLQDMLEDKLPKALYGQWYHNVAVLFITALVAFILGKLRVEMGAVIIGCFVIAVYYQTSMQQYRYNKRNDLQRVLAKTQNEADEEPVEWMNGFLQKFWLVFEPALCTLILENLDTVIGEYLPSFVESVRLTTLTLGTKPFRIESVKTYLNQDPDTVCMDWRVSFIPNDLYDLTTNEREHLVNPKIVINIHLIKGIVIPVQLEDVSFKGKMRVKIRFMNKFPYAKVFDASFLDKPDFDYNLRPLGTDSLGFDVNVIPGLSDFVRDQAHAILGPMMYAPNSFTFDVEQFFAGEMDISQANGILAVKILSASALDKVNANGGPFVSRPKSTLNPYMRFFVDNTMELGRSSVQNNTFQPEWNETHFLLLNNLNGQLCLEMNNKGAKENGDDDERVATAYFDLRELDDEDRNEQEGLDLALLHKGNMIGDIKVDMRYFAVSKPVKHEDGTVDPAPESNSAVLRLTVHECQGLVGSSRRLNPFVRVMVNGKQILRTSVAWHNTSPHYESSGETVVLDKSEVFVRVEVKDWRKVHDDTLLGVWTASLNEILEQQEANEGWWTMTMDDKPIGNLRFSAQWKPVIMRGLTQESGHSYDTPAIGVMRFTFWQARDLRNVENVGKSDPYVRVLSGFQVRERTSVIDNNLDPEWGETLYVPVHSTKEDLVLEVMDWNAKSRDKSLGMIEFSTKDMVQLCVGDQSENPDRWYESTGKKIDQWEQLRTTDRRGGKGELRYTAEFLPTLALPKPRPVSPSSEPTQEQIDTQASSDDPDNKQHVEEELSILDLHGSPIKYTPDGMVDMASYSSGVLRVKIHEVELPQRGYAYCQLVADALLPQWKSSKLKGRKLQFNETADVFIKEADISRIAIEVRPAIADEKDDRKLGYWVDNVKGIIRHIQNKRRSTGNEKTLDDGIWYSLYGDVGGRIKLGFDYIPMSSFILNPDESIDNQGNLTVTLLRAKDLKAADKSGTSDPYVVFTVNGERVHKSSVVKKTLNPVWKNEQFSVPIQSRVTASFRIEVFDWNQIQGDEPIGSGGITLRGDMVESFMAKTVSIPLDGVAGVTGDVIVRFLWQPQLLVKRRTQTSVLGTTRIGTNLSMSSTSSGEVIPTASRSRTSLFSESGHSRADSDHGSLSTMNDSMELSDANGIPAMISVQLVEARGLRAVDKNGTSDPYVRVRVGNRIVHKSKTITKTLAPTWNETFAFNVPAEPTALSFKLKDYNRFSRAVDLGECRWNIWDLVSPEHRRADQWLPLSPMGSGELHVILELSPQ
ncbi:hypothetical protein LRAMOSA03964 [Lichtheimia ramosa]|uniref:C2 domain-containing protein n=1 Tax=Lichtheimia ramosa TaxID=688394 RepID=A0A077WVP4_9FUNG|nr:hypothetical protein LRAMOSA03964 [Lichtheimia ramosa]